MKLEELNTVDLFCGAGGASTGCDDAFHKLRFKRKGLAINHWRIAVDTMRANHPNLTTLDCKIENAIPAELVHEKIHLLWASPSCVHHSRARGGKPRSDQQRAQPDFVTTWLTQCDVDNVIVENVPEFQEWGPLIAEGPDAGKPDKSKKGLYFNAWVEHIRMIGYDIKYTVLNCADYGDATTRKRFFLIGSKIQTVQFPKPMYGEGTGRPWRSARECLDLSDTGKSIFNRKKPLAYNTLRRIAVGMSKYNGMDFLMDMLGAGESDNCRLRQLELPLPTQHAGGNRFALVRPFIVKLRNNNTVEDIDKPLSTITTCDAMQVALPMLEDGRLIDIRIRMLKPSELAAAHSFPKDYILTGNRGEQVKQIGNSVPVRTASALCEQMLKKYTR